MTRTTKAQRDEWCKCSAADGYYAEAIELLCGDLDAAERERDDALALIEAARVDVRAESFLEHAQAILAKCVAPYSCEQMKAVADVLASDFRKLELVRELADKVTEERDELEAELAATKAKLAALVETAKKLCDTLAERDGEPTDANVAEAAAAYDRLAAAIAAARGGA